MIRVHDLTGAPPGLLWLDSTRGDDQLKIVIALFEVLRPYVINRQTVKIGDG
jgi:hypothetical protein